MLKNKMMTHYIYRRLFRSVRYDIKDSGIEYVSRDIHGTNRDIVGFDEIGAIKSQFSSASKVALGGAIVFVSISVMLFVNNYSSGNTDMGAIYFYLMASCLCAIYYYYSHRGGILLASSVGSLVILGKPEKTYPFVDAIYEAQVSALKKKILDRNELLNHEEVVRDILYLKDAGIIDEMTYLQFRKLLEKDADNDQSIGFNNTES